MQTSIEARELIVLDGLGVTIRGTHHKAWDNLGNSQSKAGSPGRLGLVFLNGLAATRASTGDSAVYWGDMFARRGYPCFRLDLPGYGDADGEPSSDLLGFINAGGFAPSASAAIGEIVARFGLSGVAIVGHCSGSVSAIYTAAASKDCKGLVLMEPYFHLPQTAQPEFRRRLHFWAMQSRLGGFFSKIFDVLKEISLFLHGNVPNNTNFPLVRCWKSLTSTSLPILILKVPARIGTGTTTKVGEFDFLKYVLGLAGRKSQITVHLAERANHSLANIQGREAVRHHVEDWLNTFFPISDDNLTADPISSYSAVKNNSVNIETASCTDAVCLGN
jgi:pimeloyl-ACP methyl ester carboxylesterase